MDFATIIGLVIAFGAVIGGYNLEGGNLNSIFLTSPILIVLGGTIGATTITTSVNTLIRVPHFMKIAVFGQSRSYHDTINHIVRMAERARREGILGLEEYLKKMTDPFFKKALQLQVKKYIHISLIATLYIKDIINT